MPAPQRSPAFRPCSSRVRLWSICSPLSSPGSPRIPVLFVLCYTPTRRCAPQSPSFLLRSFCSLLNRLRRLACSLLLAELPCYSIYSCIPTDPILTKASPLEVPVQLLSLPISRADPAEQWRPSACPVESEPLASGGPLWVLPSWTSRGVFVRLASRGPSISGPSLDSPPRRSRASKVCFPTPNGSGGSCSHGGPLARPCQCSFRSVSTS